MPRLPRYPRVGDSTKVLCDIVRNLIDYSRSITPQSSRSVRVSRLAGGTVFHSLVGSKSRPFSQGASYSSYFKIYDASDETSCKIGVKDGSVVAPMENYCGVVNANGLSVNVANYVTDAIAAAGTIYFWAVAYIDEEGLKAEIQTTTSAPAPTVSALAYRTRLIGRVTISASGASFVASAPNQDYLAGGEWETRLWNECNLLGGA